MTKKEREELKRIVTCDMPTLKQNLEERTEELATCERERAALAQQVEKLTRQHQEDEQKLRNTLQGLLQLNTQRDEAHLALVKLINHGTAPVGAPQTGK